MHDYDGRYPDESPVEVRYPRSKQEEQGDREQWPWLPGTIVEQCGPDEWYVCIEVRELAVLQDGRRAPRGTASRNLYYPCCFRDGAEIRRAPHPAVPPRQLGAGRAGERRRGDRLHDGGRGLRRGRLRGGSQLLPHLWAGLGPRPGRHGGPTAPPQGGRAHPGRLAGAAARGPQRPRRASAGPVHAVARHQRDDRREHRLRGRDTGCSAR